MLREIPSVPATIERTANNSMSHSSEKRHQNSQEESNRGAHSAQRNT
mgnify:FL=1